MNGIVYMPSVQLLDTRRSAIKRFSQQVTRWLCALAGQLVGGTFGSSDAACEGESGSSVKSGNERKCEDVGDEQKSSLKSKGSDLETGKTEVEKRGLKENPVSLFPSSHNVDKSLEFNASVVPCSLNVNGLQSPMSVARTPEGQMEWKMNINGESKMHQHSLSGSCSPKSDKDKTSTQDITPKTDASAESVEAMKSTNSSQAGSPLIGGGSKNDNESEMKYVCHYCDAEFKMRGYLTRHIKKHAVEKAYHCPFWDESLSPEKRCHTTGGFSRRDSYKTHLRSRHFIYPGELKSVDRVKSHGHCAQCKRHFNSTNEWIEDHIESRECEAILPTFKGNLKKSKKCGKLKMIMTSDGQSRFITSQITSHDISKASNSNSNSNSTSASTSTSTSPNNFEYNTAVPSATTLDDKSKPPLDSTVSLTSIPLQYNTTIDVKSQSQPQLISTGTNSRANMRNVVLPLDEFSSLNHSPVEDAALDSVRSISSQSSHEHTIPNKDMNFIHAGNDSEDNQDWMVLPLDVEQAGLCSNDEIKTITDNDVPKINVTLQRQMNEYTLGERHFRETQQFMNFFNYTYNYQ